MSMHIEWEDQVKDLDIEILTRREAIEALRPADTDNLGPYVLVLSSGGGGALATSGTKADLRRLVGDLVSLITRVPEEPEPGWDRDPDEEDDDGDSG